MTTEPDLPEPDEPNWRMPVGILLILFLILIWSGVVVSLIDQIGMVNFWLQILIYIIAGIAWIFPVRPIMIWMNTGKFRQ